MRSAECVPAAAYVPPDAGTGRTAHGSNHHCDAPVRLGAERSRRRARFSASVGRAVAAAAVAAAEEADVGGVTRKCRESKSPCFSSTGRLTTTRWDNFGGCMHASNDATTWRAGHGGRAGLLHARRCSNAGVATRSRAEAEPRIHVLS